MVGGTTSGIIGIFAGGLISGTGTSSVNPFLSSVSSKSGSIGTIKSVLLPLLSTLVFVEEQPQKRVKVKHKINITIYLMTFFITYINIVFINMFKYFYKKVIKTKKSSH